jgi:hypothetical protein
MSWHDATPACPTGPRTKARSRRSPVHHDGGIGGLPTMRVRALATRLQCSVARTNHHGLARLGCNCRTTARAATSCSGHAGIRQRGPACPARSTMHCDMADAIEWTRTELAKLYITGFGEDGTTAYYAAKSSSVGAMSFTACGNGDPDVVSGRSPLVIRARRGDGPRCATHVDMRGDSMGRLVRTEGTQDRRVFDATHCATRLSIHTAARCRQPPAAGTVEDAVTNQRFRQLNRPGSIA